MNAFFDALKCGNPVKLAGQAASCEQDFSTLGDDCCDDDCDDRAFCYGDCIDTCAQMIYWWHFGFRGDLSPQQIGEKGVEMAKAYFEVVACDLARAAPGVRLPDEATWFEPYSQALLLATLTGCVSDRTQFSDSLQPKLVVEKSAIPIEPALGDVLLCIAASFQSNSMDTTPLVDRLQNCRKQRPKLLFKAWQALQSSDREKFAAAIADSTANFAKTTADDDRPRTSVAVQESILAALAYERGWIDLEFGLPIAARLVTHQSLELK